MWNHRHILITTVLLSLMVHVLALLLYGYFDKLRAPKQRTPSKTPVISIQLFDPAKLQPPPKQPGIQPSSTRTHSTRFVQPIKTTTHKTTTPPVTSPKPTRQALINKAFQWIENNPENDSVTIKSENQSTFLLDDEPIGYRPLALGGIKTIQKFSVQESNTGIGKQRVRIQLPNGKAYCMDYDSLDIRNVLDDPAVNLWGENC